MKKLVLVFTVFFSLLTVAQKKKDIIYSQDIKELESFLQTAHPEDPRRKILKSRIVSIKNATWMKNGNATVSSAKPAVLEAPKIELKPIGHSHYAGENGELFTDLSTLSTALKIAKKITVSVK